MQVMESWLSDLVQNNPCQKTGKIQSKCAIAGFRYYINKNLLIQKGNETAKKVRQNFHLGCFVTGETNI